jgi:excisionase family DNA binding protein
MKQSEIPPRLLDIRQASQLLAVSVSTLYGWVWQRRIPFVKIGRAVRFDVDDLKAFIQANRHSARAS